MTSLALRHNITAALEAHRQETNCITSWGSELNFAENQLKSIQFKSGLTVDLPVSKKVIRLVLIS